jgi:ATP-dependent DNA helicase RecQ
MKDQVTALRKLNIRAAAIYSGQSHQEILEILENCVFGAYKIVYISPERISSDIFQTKLRRINVSFFTVDEAHCISQWGYDFRPSYLQITEIRKLKPGVPVLAITATATHEVVKDIQEKRLFKEENVFRMSFARKNLAYIVRHADNQKLEMYKLLKAIPGSCIIYTRNRIYSQELAEQLCKEGFSATFYHAGIHDYLKVFIKKYSFLFKDKEAASVYSAVFTERHAQLRGVLGGIILPVCIDKGYDEPDFMANHIAESILFWTLEDVPFEKQAGIFKILLKM